MPLRSSREQVVHLIDLDGEIDPLAALVVCKATQTLARRLGHPVLRGRTSLELLRLRPDVIVAWGERALEVARRSGALHGLYRPAGPTRPQLPLEGWRAAVATNVERNRFTRWGWSAADVGVVYPPGIDARSAHRAPATRAELGVGRDDFIWLLTGDSGWNAGLREAIWAATIMHVMERDHRLHRLLLWGQRSLQWRARRFIDQLGLPVLAVPARNRPYHELAGVANAALLLPQGPNSAWSAAVVAHAGLPALINQNPEVQEVLGQRRGVQTSVNHTARFVVRDMLTLMDSMGPRAAGDDRFAPDRVREQWNRCLDATISAANAAGA